MDTALVIGGSPEPSSLDLVSRLARGSDIVVAVDYGLDACMDAAVVPNMVVGDGDSVTPKARNWARAHGVPELSFPAYKDDTDLSLALAWAAQQIDHVVVSCVSGGRIDHALAVYGCLARYARLSPRIVEDDFECRILSPEGTSTWELGEDAVGKTFSVTALSSDAVASEVGMRWELDHHAMGVLFDLGVSNVVTSPSARIEAHTGVIAAFLLMSDV